ncbi:Telomerase reverse transcriptase [Lecanora helva]
MARNRKRPRSSKDQDVDNPRKRVKANVEEKVFRHPTLSLYYAKTSRLRDYLLQNIPSSSKARRRRIVSCKDDYLDETLVCRRTGQPTSSEPSRSKDFEVFSQQLNLTARSSVEVASNSQSELVDFSIWLLFHRIHRQAHRPPHMLCHGYQRAGCPRQVNEDHGALGGIPGVVCYYPNNNVDIMKNLSWSEILGLLGKESDRVMLDLLLGCGIFTPVVGGDGNYIQISGQPMTDLQPLDPQKPVAAFRRLERRPADTHVGEICRPTRALDGAVRSLATIAFVRNRMFYARAALNTKGKVSFGLRHIRKFKYTGD